MNAILQAVERFLRGPRVSRLLVRFGIDPERYWLLMDLFHELSERGEMLDQLGRNGVALETAAWLYFGLSAFMSLMLLVTQTALAAYFATFLILTAVLLLAVLLSEAGNSLVNPVEGLVLAHQPINGATYTATKLSHLLRIILYLVPGLNAVPALAGLFLKGSAWYYPLVHLAATFVAGLAAALLCCALFGWLVRFIPARRLKAAGQFASTLPFLGMMWLQQIRQFFAHLAVGKWLPAGPAVRWGLAAALGVATVAAVVLGLRSLSADYLIRVSSMTRGGPAAGSNVRTSRIGAVVSRFFGGQPGRAGFAFVSRMMLRDWQFRRQFIPMFVYVLIGLVPLLASGWRTDPFARKFAPMHMLPHVTGILLFFVCILLPYGGDYKGSWLFLVAPSRAIGGFARGVHALLWIDVIVIPHLVLLPLLAWAWGILHAGLFLAYSLAAASMYLALDLRRIDGAPFTRQADASRGSVLLPLMILGAIVVAIAVGIQYFLVFRSPAIVAATTAAIATGAFLVTRASLGAFTISIRYNLGLASAEVGALFKEVDG